MLLLPVARPGEKSLRAPPVQLFLAMRPCRLSLKAGMRMEGAHGVKTHCGCCNRHRGLPDCANPRGGPRGRLALVLSPKAFCIRCLCLLLACESTRQGTPAGRSIHQKCEGGQMFVESPDWGLCRRGSHVIGGLARPPGRIWGHTPLAASSGTHPFEGAFFAKNRPIPHLVRGLVAIVTSI